MVDYVGLYVFVSTASHYYASDPASDMESATIDQQLISFNAKL
uniref:Uncharacterized protein n=1 Tax=Arundo donax TaxID=35708 RepID=A0A0A9BVX8_ARUDO